jgi:histidinol-phosphate aminotransferase
VDPANVVTGAGADALIGHLSVAALDPGDEVVTAWPSFISYVLDALKLGAVPRRVPLVGDHYDLDALLDAIGPRTKLVYIATPNNPTGTMTTREQLDDYFERVPEHVLTVLDQAYFEYIERRDYPDGVAEYLRAGHRVLVLRTFSKIYGLAGLRVGYGVGPADVIEAIGKTRRAFDVNTQAQVAALASMDSEAELAERRRLTVEGRATLERTLRGHGLEPAGPAVANFLFVEVGEDAQPLFEALLRQGAIVRPMASFGAPGALRITVGTPEENAFFADALASVRAPTP